MKKKIALMLVLVLSLGIMLSACGGGGGDVEVDPDQTWVIKAADGVPAAHIFTEHALMVFMDGVTEATDGRVTFEHYPAGQLGKQADMLDLLKTGVADFAIIGPSYMSGSLPLSSAFELPGMFPDSLVASMSMLNLCRDGALYDAEFSGHGIKPVVGIAYSPYNICNNVRPIETVSDVKGLTIRGSGISMELSVAALGGSLVNIVPQEMYEAALRGTVDGLALSIESWNSYKMQEVIKYYTKGMNITGWTAVYAFSDRVWNSFPEDIQQIIIEQGEKASLNFGNFINESSEAYLEQFVAENGLQVTELSDEAKAEFAEALAPVEEKWLEEMEGRGLSNAADILAAVKAEIAAKDAEYN